VTGGCKCHSHPLEELTVLPKSQLDLRGHFKAGKRGGKEKRTENAPEIN